MRKLLLLSFLLTCVTGLKAQDILDDFIDKNPTPDKYIQANKYIRQDLFEYTVNKNGQMDSTLKESVNYIYYDNGLVAQVAHNDNEGFLYQKEVYSYGQHGYISRIENFSFFKPSANRMNYQSTVDFTYDSAGHEVLKVKTFGREKNALAQAINKNNHASEKKEYDSNGRLTSVYEKYRDDKPWSLYHTISYDHEGNLKVFNTYEFSNDKKPVIFFIFNLLIDGNTKFYDITDRNDKPYRKYQLNQYQQPTLITNYIAKIDREVPISSVQKFFYDADGTLRTDISYIDGQLNTMYKYYYYK